MDSLCKVIGLGDTLLPEVKTCMQICDFIRTIDDQNKISLKKQTVEAQPWSTGYIKFIFMLIV